MKRKLIAFTCVLALSGCANNSDEEYVDRSVDDLYNEAADLYAGGNYTKAAKTFIEVERQHPYSDWALRAQLRAGEAYYQSKKYEDAVETFNVFIQLHPAHPDVVYAHYMVGMCYYEQIPTIERDQQVTEMAMKSFRTIIKRYPGTSYAQDAGMKMDLIHDQIGGKEMEVGRYYLQNGSYLAALNRFKGIVQEFQTSSHVPEALHRMVECYLGLGLINEARSTAAVLGHNYPGSSWYQDSYKLMQQFDPQQKQQEKQEKEALKPQ
jgi:outer membrane protein assembly factor BamD